MQIKMLSDLSVDLIANLFLRTFSLIISNISMHAHIHIQITCYQIIKTTCEKFILFKIFKMYYTFVLLCGLLLSFIDISSTTSLCYNVKY